jgi:hypothetical protein
MSQIFFTDSELKHIALNDVVESQNWLEFNKKTSVSPVQQQQATTQLLIRNVAKKYKGLIQKLDKEFPNMENTETMPIAFALGKKRAFEKIIENLESFEFLEEDRS